MGSHLVHANLMDDTGPYSSIMDTKAALIDVLALSLSPLPLLLRRLYFLPLVNSNSNCRISKLMIYNSFFVWCPPELGQIGIVVHWGRPTSAGLEWFSTRYIPGVSVSKKRTSRPQTQQVQANGTVFTAWSQF